MILVGQTAQDSYLEVNGQRALTTTKATLGYTEKNIADAVDTYKSKAMLLTLVKTGIPVGGGLLGIVLLALGVISRRGGDGADSRTTDHGQLVGSR